jgi:hypothetical protein
VTESVTVYDKRGCLQYQVKSLNAHVASRWEKLYSNFRRGTVCLKDVHKKVDVLGIICPCPRCLIGFVQRSIVATRTFGLRIQLGPSDVLDRCRQHVPDVDLDICMRCGQCGVTKGCCDDLLVAFQGLPCHEAKTAACHSEWTARSRWVGVFHCQGWYTWEDSSCLTRSGFPRP